MGAESKVPQHIAIILDGNGRWAKQRRMPRGYGHIIGCQNLEHMCNVIKDKGVKYLTVYAFSTENGKRPEEEDSYLCKLPGIFFNRFIKDLMINNIRVTFVGELERFPAETQKVILKAVNQTKEKYLRNY